MQFHDHGRGDENWAEDWGWTARDLRTSSQTRVPGVKLTALRADTGRVFRVIGIGSDQRGIALVAVLLVLAALSLVVLALMLTTNTETQIAGRNVREQQALNAAEAGVSEATERIRKGDVPDDANPRMVTQIYLAPSGSLPALGADTTVLATQQPAGGWLKYSSGDQDADALTIRYKTDPARSVIYRYDPAQNPPVQTSSGSPVYVITSVGHDGDARRRVITETAKLPVAFNPRAAVAANQAIEFSGNSNVCGFNHQAATEEGTKGREECRGSELPSGHVPGAWSTEAISSAGSSQQDGLPNATLDHQTGFYEGPWEALGMTSSQFWSWVGPPLGAAPDPPVGIVHLDNNDTPRDRSGSFAIRGGRGEGFLYVDGDLTINANFRFEGLIYVEGNLKINGNAWILGSVIIDGRPAHPVTLANGDCTVLYSLDAITDELGRYGGRFVTISWRED